MTHAAAIPVLFHGRTVGYLPPVRVPDDTRLLVYPVLSPPPTINQPTLDDNPAYLLPAIHDVQFHIKGRDAHGTPLELHVTSLQGLLRIRTFIPEDHALPDLTQHR